MKTMMIVSTEWFEEQVRNAYVAGIIDGEGYVGLIVCNGPYRRPELSISQKSRWFIQSLSDLFPGGKIFTKAHGWEIRWLSAGAIQNILEKTLAYLTIKQDVAAVVLAICHTITSAGDRSHGFSDKDALVRLRLEQLYEQRKAERLETAMVVE